MTCRVRSVALLLLVLALAATLGCRPISKAISKKLNEDKKEKEAAAAEAAEAAESQASFEVRLNSTGARDIFLPASGDVGGTLTEDCTQAAGSMTGVVRSKVGTQPVDRQHITLVFPEPNCAAEGKPMTIQLVTEGEPKLVHNDPDSGCSGSHRIPAEAVAQIADGLEPGERVIWRYTKADVIQPYLECMMRHIVVGAGAQNPTCTVTDDMPCEVAVESSRVVETCNGRVTAKCTATL